jgi:hypothetical protein
VVPRGSVLHLTELLNDAAARPLASFHKQVSSSVGVFVNVGNWADVKGKSRKVSWWSLWTPLALKDFASVEITGASFENSICFHATNHWFSDRVTFNDRIIGADAPRASPQVRIHYFTHGHNSSTAFWSETRGRWCLNQICRYLEKIEGVGYWSGNEMVRAYMEHWFDGEMVLPKLAGTNNLIHHTSCALIYSNKAQDADDALLEIFDLDKDAVKRAREIEDVIQFTMRGALRRPDFDGCYTVFIYDLDQARALEQ